MPFSFREKSLTVIFLSLVSGFGYYFGTVLPVTDAEVQPQQVARFVGVVILLIVLQIVGHIGLAIVDRRTESDERDRLIQLKGHRNASYTLASGVFFALCAAVMTEGNFIFTHVLLAFWVLAQLVEIGSQLYLYRRGV